MKAIARRSRGHAVEHAPGRGRDLRDLLLRHPGWSVAAVLLIAFNLRPAITSIAPFMPEIRHDLGLSGLGVSLLTMAPVLCLGLFAPLAPVLARRVGVEAVLVASMLAVAVGVVLRSFGSVPFYLGTLTIGAGMSLLGVLSPVVVKRDFPRRVGSIMGLYTMLISLGAALSTATAVPLRHALGGSWTAALLFWALPALAAAVVFIPQLFRHQQPHGVAGSHAGRLLRDPLAWQVTGFLALVGSLAYAVFTWGPSMLQARGVSAASSGFIVSLSYLAQMATGLFVPMLAGRQRKQRLLSAVLVTMTTIGLLGFVFAPVGSLPAFSIVLGLGQGGAFGLALSLIILRSGDQHVAAQLSGLAQCIGYVVAGLVGPFAVGLLHDWAGSWNAVAVFYAIVGTAALVLGWGAGRDRTIQLHPRGK